MTFQYVPDHLIPYHLNRSYIHLYPIYLPSHLVSSLFISSHQISSHRVSSCLISFHLVLSHLEASIPIISHHVPSCLIMSHHVSSCLIMSQHVLSGLTVSHHVSSCHIISHHVSSCLIMTYSVSSCFIVSHHVSRHVSSCFIMSYHISSQCHHLSMWSRLIAPLQSHPIASYHILSSLIIPLFQLSETTMPLHSFRTPRVPSSVSGPFTHSHLLQVETSQACPQTEPPKPPSDCHLQMQDPSGWLHGLVIDVPCALTTVSCHHLLCFQCQDYKAHWIA